jgi:transcriptional regulator with XRE-family HTH domain
MIKPKIKEWIVKKDITGKELAEHLGVSENQVSIWVKGKGYPRFEKLWKMAKFLGCKMDDLYEEKE